MVKKESKKNLEVRQKKTVTSVYTYKNYRI